jgi:hypothetical protein
MLTVVGPHVALAIEVQLLYLKLNLHPPKFLNHLMVQFIAVFIRRKNKQIEIACNRPQTRMQVPNSFKLLEEGTFVHVMLGGDTPVNHQLEASSSPTLIVKELPE